MIGKVYSWNPGRRGEELLRWKGNFGRIWKEGDWMGEKCVCSDGSHVHRTLPKSSLIHYLIDSLQTPRKKIGKMIVILW